MKYIIYCLLFIPTLLVSQIKETNGVIIEYNNGDIERLITSITSNRDLSLTFKKLGHHTNVYLINGTDDTSVFNQLKNRSDVVALEYNHKLTPRIKPNDTRINEQYALNLVKAFDSWDITTGGKNFNGEDIVIGIVDDGFELSHEDLEANIYVNPDEVPNDNKDNDGNGYKDDVNGWNTRTESPTHDVKSHGTNILGVIGAKGDNQKGVSGINWNIKMLPVTTGTFVSDVIESYDYFLTERKQYNSSNGIRGSNILVVSYSGGLSNAFAEDHPIWCGIYDKLGKEGVLSVAATTNENDNVEEVGDMPSTCGSPYLLVVNSTNKADEKDAVTGFGNISVDISAPGESILTTDLDNKGKYRNESGTSLSTPMVAGAAILLHSVVCQGFYNLVKSDPANAALKIKEILLSSVDKKTSLAGKTVSGGRLNISKAINQLSEQFCSEIISVKGALKINNVTYLNDIVNLDYISPDSKDLTLKLYDSSGKEVFSTKITPPDFGQKVYSFSFEQYLTGAFYYVSLISDNDVASKGFSARAIER